MDGRECPGCERQAPKDKEFCHSCRKAGRDRPNLPPMERERLQRWDDLGIGAKGVYGELNPQQELSNFFAMVRELEEQEKSSLYRAIHG